MIMRSILMASGFGLIAAVSAGAAQAADEAPMDILAARVRDQGLTCSKPESAKRDEKDSSPDESAWILTCENDVFRMKLVPDMADKIERVDKK